jgi:hypothetical protein
LLLGEVPPVLAIVGGVICIAGVVVVRTPSLGRLRASAVVSLVLALGIGACGGGTVSPGPTVAPSASSAALAPTNPPATVPPIPTLPPVGSLPIGRIVFDRVQGTAEGDFQGAFILGPEGTEAPIDAQPGAEFLIAIWSPDGRTMLVDTYLPAGPQVDTLDIASGRYTPLHAGGLHGALECTDWSPDGKTVICFLGNDAEPAVEGIYAVTVADGSAVRLTASPFHHVVGASGECGGGEGRAVYSADGKRFAFEQQRCGTGPDPSSDEAGNIVVANADGSGQTEIVAFGGVRTHAGGELSWSPADDVIAFGTQDGALSTIRADGTGLQTISLPVSGFAYGPSWSPDGKWILVTIRSGRTGQTELYAVMPDGSSAVRLTDNALIEAFTDWGPAKP